MKVAVIGAGPAGLYFSYLLKATRPDTQIRVFEQNPADATFGFGVVFSDRALEFLRKDDPQTYDLITPRMESWSDITLDLMGEIVRIDGIGFSAIGRRELLNLLRRRAESVGIDIEYESVVRSLDALAEFDLIVGADGVNSLARGPEFGASVTNLPNRFVWYGTTRIFETLSQTFRMGPHGAFNAHHYRYSSDMSTFIVETEEATWARAGFNTMSADDAQTYCERVFGDVLRGRPLVSNKSVWRSFPKVENKRWSVGKVVLVGDALHTAHFSIGSGTRLAMEDAIALVASLRAQPDNLPAALAAYEATRRPVLQKIVSAADRSANWYADFAEHMKLAPIEFAMSYIMRSGRVDPERLRQTSPLFMAAYDGATRVT